MNDTRLTQLKEQFEYQQLREGHKFVPRGGMPSKEFDQAVEALKVEYPGRVMAHESADHGGYDLVYVQDV